MSSAAAIVTAATGLALAGCGSGAKPAAHYTTSPPTTRTAGLASPSDFTAPTTTTLASAQTGAIVRCTDKAVSAKAEVPPPGHGTAVFADGISSSASLQLTRRPDGSLVVACSP